MLAWVAAEAFAGDLYVSRRGTLETVEIRVDGASVMHLDGASAPVAAVPDGLHAISVETATGAVVCAGKLDLGGAVRITVTPEACLVSASKDARTRLDSGPAQSVLSPPPGMQVRMDGAELTYVVRVDDAELEDALRIEGSRPADAPSTPVGELRVDRGDFRGEVWVTVDGAKQLAPNGYRATVQAGPHTVVVEGVGVSCRGTASVADRGSVVIRIGADGSCTGF